MEHFIVDMQTEKSKKYYFIREEVSQEIVLLPSQYLMHKMRAKGSPNTIKRSALVISYYLNYLSENQLTMEDVWNMKYEKQQEHFTDFLIWLKAGMHSKDEYTKKPYNETCNAYLKEVFRLYNFAEQQEGCEQSLKVLSDAQYIVRNSVGIRKILNRRSFHGYLKETGHIGRTIEQDKIVILLKACANCRDQVLLLLLAETVNRQILDITKFYEYLKIKKHIKAIPFHPEYYEQKVYPIHHDRSVDEDIYMEILHKLNLFPEELRLIFLHLWATGLRISEVCTLKGDAYYWDGEDAWIKVYQIKMKADKMIPVPFMLYEVMQQYIKKNHIHANDYVFQAEQGGAYRIGSFVKRFRTQCKKHKIADCEYVFKTHDYRHTLATQFYDDGVPIQTIRDYLGHVAEEMTKQYVDYMPKKIEKANDNYFDKPENNIALTITPKKRRYRHEKG